MFITACPFYNNTDTATIVKLLCFSIYLVYGQAHLNTKKCFEYTDSVEWNYI